MCVKVTAFCGMVPYSLIEVYQRLEVSTDS
jgi:hypothetical protein